MYELQRLRLGDRPVTGKGYKQAVEEFFTNSISNESPSSTEHRPEAVLVEVQGLVERRPVSAVLNSANFRRRLEDVVRNSMSGSRLCTPATSVHTRIQRYHETTRLHRAARAPMPPVPETGGTVGRKR